MLRTLYFTEDIMKRYRCRSKDTARRYMREMGAHGAPLFVTEEMVTAWENRKRSKPQSEMKIKRRAV